MNVFGIKAIVKTLTEVPRRLCTWALLTFALMSCVSSQPPPRPLDFPFARIYIGSFNDVWSATVRILDLYSITVANREAGLLQTEWVESRFNSELFKYPDDEPRLEEVNYRLKIKLSKAFISQTGQAAVRVQVLKELKEYKNFFSDWERVPTDGYEEKIILYRIGQRLSILNAQREAKNRKKKEETPKDAPKTADPGVATDPANNSNSGATAPQP